MFPVNTKSQGLSWKDSTAGSTAKHVKQSDALKKEKAKPGG